MAPLTIYPDRKHLRWLIVFSIMLGLFFIAGAILLSWAATMAYGNGPVPILQAFLLASSLAFGLVFVLLAGSYWFRYRSKDPAMTIEDRGLRLLDRPPVSLAKRPVFLPWHEIATLRFERSHYGRSMHIQTHDGKGHRMIVSVLDISLDALAEQCLKRAHKAGFIGTSEKRDFLIAGHTEWRLTPS